jgi:hypothetical protein
MNAHATNHRSLLFAAFAIIVFGGCAESTVIRTSPPGATIYCDGTLVGISPTSYRVPRSALSEPHTCRAELDGFEPADEQLRRTFAPGRAVGAVFTLGIVYLFKSPYSLRDQHDLVMRKLSTAAVKQPQADALDRLERLQRLRDAGTITEQEFQQYKAQIGTESQ